MTAFAHGGDICTYGAVLDFSANLNPLGMPPEVKAAAEAAVCAAIHYPDPYCREVRAAIATRDGVPIDHVVCGNGAADLIFRLCLALRPKSALITAPTFSEYEQALELTGCVVRRHMLLRANDFELGEDILDEIGHETDIIFLCTPNNPTGRLINPELVEKIAAKCLETGTVMVLDECFLELCDDTRGFAHLLRDNTRLVLMRAFTKSFAIPGLRFGYALCADGALLNKLSCCAQPWSVSTVAQAAGVAACRCSDWAQQGREMIFRERPKLISEMRQMGLAVWDSSANYLLFQAKGVCDLREKMALRGVLIRSCANYHGLGDDFYRIAVRPAQENAVCMQTLREVLKSG